MDQRLTVRAAVANTQTRLMQSIAARRWSGALSISISCRVCRLKQEALVGGVGQEYVQSVLSTTKPAAAVATIQKQAGLPDPSTRPLLQLLDQLGRSR